MTNDNNKSLADYDKELISRARKLRSDMTPQERHLWYDYLRTYPVKFYRQRIIDHYIADFYCSKARLVIEIDGSQHLTDNGVKYDEKRTEVFKSYNITVIRFTNWDVEETFHIVCEKIDSAVKELLK